MPATPHALNRREALLSGLAALALAAAFFHFALREMVYFRDLITEFYPMKFFLAGELKQGRIPLWNPSMFLGMPFLGELAAACFYPLNVLFLFLSPLEGLRYYLLLHYPFAGLGMYWLLRDLRLHPASAALGALAFGACGYLIAQHCNLIYLISPCYFPWALFCFRRAALRFSYGWTLAAALTVALPFFAGEPQGAGLAAALGVGFAAFAGWPERRWFSPRTWGPAGLALGLAAGWTAVQFLPSWEFARLTTRGEGLSWHDMTCWSFYPLRLVELVWPNFWGLPWPEDHYWGAFMTDWCYPIPWSLALYLGLWPVIAAALAFTGRDRHRWFFGAVAALGLLMALGRYTPFFQAVGYVFPPLRLFRYPEKYLAVVSLGLAALAGLGAEAFRTSEPSRRRTWTLRMGLGALTLLAAAAWLSRDGLESWFAVFLRRPGVGHLLAPEAAAAVLRSVGHTGIVAALLLALLEAGRTRGKWLAPALFVLTFGDLYFAQRPQIPTTPSSLFTAPSRAAEWIWEHHGRNREKFRFCHDLRSMRIDYSFGPASSSGLTRHAWTWLYYRDSLRPNCHVVYGLESMTGYAPAPLLRTDQLLDQGLTPALIKAFNVEYALVASDWSQFDLTPGMETLAADPGKSFRLLHFTDALPRAYVVPRARVFPNDQKAHDYIDSADWKNEVVMVNDRAIPAMPEEAVYRPAVVADYQPDRVVIEADGPGWLVLADAYDPGWQARVNGVAADIYRADYILRAVPLGPGHSRVEFDYRPQSYRTGKIISLLSAGLALLGWAAARLRRRWYSQTGEP